MCSLGQQRLVLLARALTKDAQLLILDEPYQGVDWGGIERANELLGEVCNATKTVIFVTHREEEIPQWVDKRLRLDAHIV